eukprot:TRINITY_DN20918_c0_g2_i1.p2 TRINITY_DN20918_c0_g2~~TRINITY_DN20918_c0_g2_i1.p2  ORF type:complete len:270 (+),score=79.18 TRINITY_DN20918_c0_g2_i1:93-812(+)
MGGVAELLAELLAVVAGYIPLAELVTRFGVTSSACAAAAHRALLNYHIAPHDRLAAWALDAWRLQRAFRKDAELHARAILALPVPYAVDVLWLAWSFELVAGETLGAAWQFIKLQFQLLRLRRAAAGLLEGVAAAGLRRAAPGARELLSSARDALREARDAYAVRQERARALSAACETVPQLLEFGNDMVHLSQGQVEGQAVTEEYIAKVRRVCERVTRAIDFLTINWDPRPYMDSATG